MTLIKKMALAVLTMLFLVFAGTYLITVDNARNFFMQQMESNAQDTATSLGLSLSQSLKSHDVPTMNSMAQAVFDRGYFSSIEIKNMKEVLLVSKKITEEKKSVPAWFERLVHWPMTAKDALVMDGWMQVGVVSVVSNPNYAYEALWRNAIGMVKAYVLFALCALLLAYGFIQYLLAPLKRITAQALAISDHQFPIETQVPKTPELRQVTLAMNQMVLKVKSLFTDQVQQMEVFRAQAYQDPLTGLHNRRYFLQQLSAILDNDDEFVPGYALMIVVNGLDNLNQQQGYQAGDELIVTITEACKEFWSKSSVHSLARISGSTFALINQERDPLLFVKECKEFELALKDVTRNQTICAIHMGAAKYFRHQSLSNLLQMIDLAVKKADENNVFYCQLDHDVFKYPQIMTSDEIAQSIQEKNMVLYAQSVTDGVTCLHQEIFVRIRDAQKKEELGAGHFMPTAEQLKIAHLIDLHVLNEISNKNLDNFALNLSQDTLLYNTDAYLQRLAQVPKDILRGLSLEISESFVLSHFEEVSSFVKEAKILGVKIGVDKVGIQFAPLHYLIDLHVDYLKLHGSLVQDIDENESKQFFIHYFNKMAKTLDIQVVATQVEDVAQWEVLQRVEIIWGQGRYLAPIELVKTK